MALLEAPSAMTFVLTAKFVTLGGIVSRLGPVAHSTDFRPAEQ
ncbi:hypothetical protein [Actinoplanes regularis]|nr:hypothetical protein [Actinoplanes regularis]